MSHLREEELMELALTTQADRDDHARAQLRHVEACATCARELALIVDALSEVVSASTTAHAPPSLRAKVLGLAEPGARFSGFVSRVAELFDFSEDDARRVLAAIDHTASWEEGPIPGVLLYHLKGGPRVAAADTGLVYFAPGISFPRHKHKGDEEQIILQGGFLEDSGREYLAGDLVVRSEKDQHSFVVHADEPCILALVLHGGMIEIL